MTKFMKMHNWTESTDNRGGWARNFASGLKQRFILPPTPTDCTVWKTKLAELQQLNTERDMYHHDTTTASTDTSAPQTSPATINQSYGEPHLWQLEHTTHTGWLPLNAKTKVVAGAQVTSAKEQAIESGRAQPLLKGQRTRKTIAFNILDYTKRIAELAEKEKTLRTTFNQQMADIASEHQTLEMKMYSHH